MQKIKDKIAKHLICGAFLTISVPAARATGVSDLGQNFQELSQTIKTQFPNVRYHLVLERNVGLRCEDRDGVEGHNAIDLDDIPEEFYVGKGECANLAGADLRAYELANFNFSGAYMRKANLNGVDLRGSNFYGTDLSQADLRGADLRDAKNLITANIKGAIFDMETKFPWVEGQAKIHGMICVGDPDWCMDQ